jgi:hypothetical protein
MFKSFGFSPLKQKSAGKSARNRQIFLQILLRILAIGTKIKKDFHMQGLLYNKKDTGTKTKNL